MAGKIIKVKASDHEDLSEPTIKRVIEALAHIPPCTKKHACEMLNISYNTSRLAKIIEQYEEKVAYRTMRRAEKRGKSATPDEIQTVATEYLEGKGITEIAQMLFRSTAFIKSIIAQYGVPTRQSSKNYFTPELIPDRAVRERFAVGEGVYSARYDCYATIKSEELHKSGEYVYRIFLEEEDSQMFAYQPASELASLQHLRDLGIKL
jgi:transposase